jgi:N-acetylgalactosamine kinase
MTRADRTGIGEQTAVVILAAGKGTRMGRADLAKVCFEIDGKPAISRIIETFKRCRFRRFVLVVGALADQVMATVAREHPEVTFVFQEKQLGTGHAARAAKEALQAQGHSGPVLVAMGDKYVEPAAVEALVEGFIKQQADFALLTIPKTKATEVFGGRVCLAPDGQVVAIVEKVDLVRQTVADALRSLRGERVGAETILELAAAHLPDEKKRATALKDLLALAKRKVTAEKLKEVLASERYNLRVGGAARTAVEIERMAPGINPSMYLFTAEAFYQAVGMLTNDNAQGEYYLTDAVKHLAGIIEGDKPRFRIRAVPVEDAALVQGFNSPDELLAIQDYVRRRKRDASAARATRPRLTRKQYASCREWLERLEQRGPSLQRWMVSIYGDHAELHEEKRKHLRAVLQCYGKRFGFDEKVVIVRAPGRINLMGRHVDHRGGYNNFLAIHRETIAAAGLRPDDRVVAVNVEPRKFPAVEFSIAEVIGRFAWSDWLNFINSDWVRNLLRTTAGEWGNYIKAAVLRLQNAYQDLKISGLNIALFGDVPIAAGLSSSSTIVVATLQAAIALNGLELTSQQFIDMCGEGEWFVGSRGGSGDHAAISLGQRGKIAQVGYLPFRVERVIEAPKDYQVVIADSHIKAAKSKEARHLFNARIASYNLGLALLRQRCPDYAGALEHVRDIDPEKLGCTTSDLYRMLLKIPESMTRKDFTAFLSSDHAELLERNFATHDPPPSYHVRGVLMFGAAETARSRMCIDLLERGRIDAFGELMKISHDGDRIVRTPENLEELIGDLKSEDPARVQRAQLYRRPGAYACSTAAIDSMVDTACAVKGVAGAQIAGAGLGGCIMVLVRRDAVAPLRRALIEAYYRPRELEPAILPCRTVEGAGLAAF